jgi:hypothetical protein
MIRYASRSGKQSGVIAYEIGFTFIPVQFTNHMTYKYTYATAGTGVVEEMKLLAKAQEGLNTFIAQNKPGFE